MTQQMWYLDVSDQKIDVGYLDMAWLEEVDSDPRCCGYGCGSVRPEFYGTSIDVRVRRPPRGHVQSAPLVDVVSRALLELIRPHLLGATCGRCVLATSGEPLSDHATIYSTAAASAVLRGAPGTRYRRCRYCGLEHIRRPAKTSDEIHLDKDTIREGAKAVQILGQGGIAVVDALREQMEALPGERVEFYGLPIR